MEQNRTRKAAVIEVWKTYYGRETDSPADMNKNFGLQDEFPGLVTLLCSPGVS